MFSSKFGHFSSFKLLSENSTMDRKKMFFDSLICDKHFVVNAGCIENMEGPSVEKNSIASMSSKSSNFPRIDLFIKSLIGKGYITKILMFENSNTNKPIVVYNIKDFNFCQNVMRNHKSNTIYYVADISRQCVFQKCYKCLGFRGPDVFM